MGAEDILNRKGGGPGAADFVGQQLTILDFTEASGQFGDYVTIDAVNQSGEEIRFKTGAVAIVEKVKDLKKGGFLPIDVRVISYPGQFGNPGYDISPV